MRGFFRDSSLKMKVKKKNRRRQCGACGLWKRCNSPKMSVTGEGHRKIFILAESPSQAEDRKGVQLVGKGGLLLKRKLKKIGIDLQRDCWKMNSILCRVTDKDGKSVKAKDSHVDYCRPSVIRELKEKKPKIIILLGSIAIKSFLGDRWHKDLGGIDKWRGWAIPDREYNAIVVPMFHPIYILRSEKNPVVETIFDNDIQLLKSILDKPFPDLPDDSCCEVLTKEKDIENYLLDILKYKTTFAFDYETTGLKPHAKGHKIASVAMCWQLNRACSWEWKRTPIALYRKIMVDPTIRKIAANMKMEDHWTAVRGRRMEVNGWLWDTMNAAHLLDNRKGITSLKFDVYKRYGIVDYDSSIEPYLISNSNYHGANGLNRIFEAPREELLLYNAKDAFYTYHLAMDQMKEIGFKI